MTKHELIELLSDVKDDEEIVFSFNCYFDNDELTEENTHQAHFTRQDVDDSHYVIQLELKDGTESEIDMTLSNQSAVDLFTSIRNLDGSFDFRQDESTRNLVAEFKAEFKDMVGYDYEDVCRIHSFNKTLINHNVATIALD